MSSVRRPGSGGNGDEGNGDESAPAPGLDPELAEAIVQAARSSGVDVADARTMVKNVDAAIATRAELGARLEAPASLPPNLRARGFANELRARAADFTASPAAASRPRDRRRRGRADHVREASSSQVRGQARRRLERYRAELIEAGQLDADPQEVPRRVWSAARAAATPKGAARAIARLPKRLALAVRRASLGEPGAEQYNLEERRAVVVAAVVIWKLGRESRLHGCSKVTVGYPRRLIAAVVGIAVRGRPYEVGALFGTRHRGAGVPSDRRGPRGGIVGDFRRGECGFVVALEQCGVLWRRQPPSDVVHARELGPPRRGRDGRAVQFAFTQYRFTSLEAPDTTETPPASSSSAIAPPATAQPP